MSGPRRSSAVLLAFAIILSLAPLASASPAETRAIREVTATAFFGTPRASIRGSVADPFGAVLASFAHDSGEAESWNETDATAESDSSAEADQVYAMTSGPGGPATVDATGGATARHGVEARRVDASSDYSVTFEVAEPTPFAITGSVSASANTSGIVLGVAAVSLAPGVFAVSVKAETSGQAIKPVSMSGTLPPGDYSLSLSAGASGGIGRSPPNTVGSVAFDIIFTLNPAASTAPIVLAGGPEASNLELQVDSSPPGFRYTFTDSAPLQISDSRCQPPAGGAIVCESPVAVPVNADLGAGDDTLQLTGGHAFSDLTVEGGGGNDTLVASPTATGGDENDTITSANCGADPQAECLLEGGPGDDVLTGGAGDDFLQGGTGSDQLTGGGGRDTAAYSDFDETVVVELDISSQEPGPEQGSDTLAADIEDLLGGSGDDELTGGALDNQIDGLDGDDVIAGDIGADELIGNAGDDVFIPAEADGADTFEGDEGRDTVDYAGVTADVTAKIGGEATVQGDPDPDTIGADIERIQGGEGFDILTGSSAGDEELLGGPGDDELVGEGGADVLDGGEGPDLVTYAGPERVFVDLSNEDADDGHVGEGDKLLRVEDVTGGDGNDFLIGNAEANRLLGEGGDDDLVGGAGFNFLDGGPGDDVLVDDDEGRDAMEGGEGVDTADYSADTLGVIVDPEGGPLVPCNDGAQQHDCVFDDVEDIAGGSGDDILTGTAARNVLTGRGGEDELNGLGGNDTLDAGAGGGTMDGGDGDDELLGGNGEDDLFGGDDDDELLGAGEVDKLFGGAGDDTLDGGPGPDVPIDGGDGVDTLLYAERTRNLVVDPEPGGLFAPADDGEAGEGDQVLDTVENLTAGSGDDTLTGTGGANTLIGNDGGDVLNGLGGADVLEGGFGTDTLLSQDGGIRDEVFCGPSFDAVAADSVDNVSGDCESVTFPVLPPPPPAPPGANTPPGTNVSVRPTDSTTLAQPVTVTFSTVTAPGQTSLVTSPAGPLPPAGFQVGTPPRQYDITTTAQFIPPVTVCIDTTGVSFPGGVPRLFHFENGAWVDVTTSVNPPQVCGVVNSLSPFAAFAPKRAVKAVRCVVPNVRGKTLAAARKALSKGHCRLGKVRRVHSGKVRKGRVVAQAPRPRTKLKKNAKVTVVVSRGRRR